MSVDVIEPGLATSIQDQGRSGAYNVGIPPSGALDQGSAVMANLLVGNPVGAAVLEAPYLGPKLVCRRPTTVAVTGGKVKVLINGAEASAWESLPLQADDELSFGYIEAGARIYIAFGGGIDVPEVLGSRSTYTLGGLGGLNGRTLKAGDSIPLNDSRPYRHARIDESARPPLSSSVELRIVMGLYDYRLTPDAVTTLLDAEWSLTQVADRTGFRYGGPKLGFVDRVQPFGAGSDPSNIVDAGYPIGSIQVPSGAEPIILHRDAVSGGGYAMVGTVISADMDIVGQSAPSTVTKLTAVSLDEALAIRQDRGRRLAEIADALA